MTDNVQNVIIASSDKSLQLDSNKQSLTLRELSSALTKNPSKGISPGVGPDFTITLMYTDGSTRVFQALGNGAVLHEVSTDNTWQFYFGQTLLMWLHDK